MKVKIKILIALLFIGCESDIKVTTKINANDTVTVTAVNNSTGASSDTTVNDYLDVPEAKRRMKQKVKGE